MPWIIIALFLFSTQLYAQSALQQIDLSGSEGRKVVLSQDMSLNAFYGIGYTNGRMDFYADKSATGSPNMVFTSEGNLGIGLTNPDHPLQVRGDAKIEGEVHTLVNGSANMLALAYGVFNTAGSKQGGTNNIFATRINTGLYRILVTNETLSNSSTVVMATPITFNQAYFANVTWEQGNGILINIYDLNGNHQDVFFKVVVFKH